MKKLICLILAIALSLSSFVTVSALQYGQEYEGDYGTDAVYFDDVPPSHWAYEETKRCKEKGWFDGYPDGTFHPDAIINRAEAIKVIVSFVGRKVEKVRFSNYHDVDVTDWFAPYIHAGEDLFPSKWNNGNAFQPEMPMTREDSFYALVVALGHKDCKHIDIVDESVLNMFNDKNSISSVMSSHIAYAISEGIVSGYPDGTIRAQDSLTRAQFAAILFRASHMGTCTTAKVLQTVSVSPSSRQSLTVGDSFTFSGKARYSDNSTVTFDELNPYDFDYSGVVRIDGNTVTALKEGTCVIKFDCDYPEPTSVTVNVTNPTDAPKIKIYSYPDSTEDEYVEISGTVTDKSGTDVDFTCNGKDIRLSGDSFSYTAKLNVGKNDFEFVAENEYGNDSTKTVTIYREESKPTTVTMENVVGKSESSATGIIEGLGLRVDVETIWDENIAEGTVVKQSISDGEEVEIGKTVIITVSGGKNDWVGWTDSLPSYVNGSDYIIEEKTQYRYKKMETTTSSSSSKSGWTLFDQDESWGSWSGWSRNSVSGSSTREVETKSVSAPSQSKTQWHYTRYYGWNPNKNGYVTWPWKGTYSKTYQESGWRDNPMQNRGKGDGVDAICYYDSGDSISPWWWNETTRTVNVPGESHTEYRYRDKTVTYYFSRWADWSNWQDSSVNENDSTKAETRKVYRYKFK